MYSNYAFSQPQCSFFFQRAVSGEQVSLRLSTGAITLNKTVSERASSADMAAPQQQQAIPGGNATRTTVQQKRKCFESDVGAISLDQTS
jgi:hypothetical protein